MWSYIAEGVFLALAIYFLVQGIRCGAAVRESKNRLAAYNAQTAALSYGVVLDASITNPDMVRNFEDYTVKDLEVPTLIFHAKDDKVASYIETERAVARFPDCTFVPFESGGHLLTGHGEEIKEVVSDFVENSLHCDATFTDSAGGTVSGGNIRRTVPRIQAAYIPLSWATIREKGLPRMTSGLCVVVS